MTSIFLTLTFCLGLGTAHCTNIDPPQSFKNEEACGVASQSIAAAWLASQDLPWRLFAWTCGPGKGRDI